jgi:ABC-type glycerol-3-phosphate transport system substrate-binding protein
MYTKRFLITILSLALVASLAACSRKSNDASTSSSATASGELTMTTSFSPNPPKQGPETITVTVKNATGDTVKGATVKIKTNMASMSMSAPTLTATDQGDGTYVARTKLDYATTWTFDVSARADGKSGEMRTTSEIK